MATISKGYSFGAMEQVTAAKLHSLVDSASITAIATADISNNAVTNDKIATVDGSKFTGLASIASGAGVIPAANLPTDNVKLTGDQTVAGVKTFGSFPVTPSEAPTTDYQVANKKYVDESVSLGATTSVSSSCDGNPHQVSTNGFLEIRTTHGDGTGISIDAYADANSNPSTVKQQYITTDPTAASSFTMLVKKDHYWKVVITTGKIASAYWTPLG